MIFYQSRDSGLIFGGVADKLVVVGPSVGRKRNGRILQGVAVQILL